MGLNAKVVQQLYVAYFNRPADVGGLQYWENVVEQQNGSTAAISSAFAQSSEYKNAYAGLTNQQLVNRVYQNLFGREAEPGGLTYWSDLLDRKLLSIDSVVTQVALGAQGTDKDAYAAKVDGASLFTGTLNTLPLVRAYDGDAANEVAKAFISSIINNASLAQVGSTDNLQLTIDQVVAAHEGRLPVNIRLTSGKDQIGPDASHRLDGNDIINADANGTIATLNDGDVIDGGLGSNTLNLASSTHAPLILTDNVQIAHIEYANIQSDSDVVIDSRTWDLRKLVLSSTGAVSLKAGVGSNVQLNSQLHGDVVNLDGGMNVTVAATATAGGGAINVSGAVGAVNVSVVNNVPAQNGINISGGSSIEVHQSNAASLPQGSTLGRVAIMGDAFTRSVLVDNHSGDGLGNSGDVRITDGHFLNGKGSIGKVSVQGVSGLLIQANSVTSLSVTNGTGDIVINNADPGAATRLDLTLNDTNSVSFADTGAYHTLNITANSSNSDKALQNLDARGLTTLNVDVVGTFSLENSIHAPQLRSLNVSGVGAIHADLQDLKLSLIDLSQERVSAYYNNLNLDGAVPTKVIGGGGGTSVFIYGKVVNSDLELRSGYNSVYINSATALHGVIDGGGSNQDVLFAPVDLIADVVAGKSDGVIRNFEQFLLEGELNKQSIDLAYFGPVSYVGFTQGGSIALHNLPNNVRLALQGDGVRYDLASVQGADSIALSLSGDDTTAVNYASDGVYLSSVKHVAITTLGGRNTPLTADTLNLFDSGVQSISFDGYRGIKLNNTDTSLQSITVSVQDAIGGLTYTAPALISPFQAILTGQAGTINTLDLRAALNRVSYTGGDGQDIVTVGAKAANVVDVGSSGQDHVTIAEANRNTQTFTTIDRAHAGVTLSLLDQGQIRFYVEKEVLPSGASLDDHINATLKQGGNASVNGAVGWFQYQGNTFVVESRHDATAMPGFQAGVDVLVKLTGLVDLSHAAFFQHHDLLLA